MKLASKAYGKILATRKPGEEPVELQEHNRKVKPGRPGHLTEVERFESRLKEKGKIGSS